MPPIIAITAPLRTDDGVARVRLAVSYARAVERAGALPVIVPPLADNSRVGRMLDAVDGLLLAGGEDVDPARYDAPRHPTVTDVSPERDATELALLAAARQREKPVLAICRGIQLLNVALGGTLVQDLASERPSAGAHNQGNQRDARVHDVAVEPESRLATSLGVTALRVNSFHHQAPDRIARSLRATAWSPDGIVEGLEWPGASWWVVGVQWHPEELDGRTETGLFRAFVKRAGQRGLAGLSGAGAR